MSDIKPNLENYIQENLIKEDLLAVTWCDVSYYKGNLNWKSYVVAGLIIIVTIFSEKLGEVIGETLISENLAKLLTLPIIISALVLFVLIFLIRWHYKMIKPKTNYCLALTDKKIYVIDVHTTLDKEITATIDKEYIIADITRIKHYLTNLLSEKWHIEIGEEEIMWFERKSYWHQSHLLNNKGTSLYLLFNKLCSTSNSEFNWNSLTLSFPQKFLVNAYGLVTFLFPFVLAALMGYVLADIEYTVKKQQNKVTYQNQIGTTNNNSSPIKTSITPQKTSSTKSANTNENKPKSRFNFDKTPKPAWSKSLFAGKTAIITDPDDYTNVRAGKGTNTSIVYRLKPNEKFTVYPSDEKWWRVQNKNILLGYIYHDRVHIIDENLNGDYTIASNKVLTHSDLMRMPKNELQLMRNEIFARYGYIFKGRGAMDIYFRGKRWYRPLYKNVDSKLTDIEKKNIELIQRYENRNLNLYSNVGYTNGTNIILRNRPSTKSSIVGSIKNSGERLKILDSYYTNNRETLINQDLNLKFNDGSIYLLEKGKSVTVLSKESKTVKIEFKDKNLRTITATIYSSYIDNDDSSKWYKVKRYTGETGWVFGKFIDLDN